MAAQKKASKKSKASAGKGHKAKGTQVPKVRRHTTKDGRVYETRLVSVHRYKVGPYKRHHPKKRKG